jgi:hypothetical protein
VDVVAMGDRLVDPLAQVAVAVEARAVALEVLDAGAPVAAVPDDLIDAHPARERVRQPGDVRRQEQLDELSRRRPVGGEVDVEVPVDRAVLRVQRRLPLPPLLAAVGAPRRAAGIALQPLGKRGGSGLRPG